MQSITATFEDGMLRPTQPLNLPAHAEVRVTIELLPASPLTVGNLNEFLRGLPPLGDDAADFAQEVRAVRARLPARRIASSPPEGTRMWSFLTWVAVVLGSVAATPSRALCAEPEVTVKTHEGWFKTTHTISMNKEAAERLRDAVDRVDPKLVGGALTTAAPHPVMKIVIALVTGNADAFKRALNKGGAVGPGGLTITLTAYGGWLAKHAQATTTAMPNPLEGNVANAMQVAVNPWSWSIAPRN